MIRRAFVSLLMLVGVLVTPNLIGFGTPPVGAAGPVLTPVDPARLLDTRPDGETIDGQAQRSGIQTGKTTFELPVTGRGGVPADATAVMLNVTAVTPTGLGFITVYPCGIDRPLASNLNFTTTSIPNAVFAKIGADGKVCVYTETATHILADVNAYVAGGASPTPLNPARLLDTRPTGETTDGQAQRTGIQNSQTTFELQVTGRGGVPADASAVMLNVTAANPTGLGFITVFPCGIDRPLASNLNFVDTNVPNAVLAKIGTGGKVCIYTETTTHILADVNAYVPKDGSPTSLNPGRLLDTRPTGETVDGQAQRTGIQIGKTTFELQVTSRGGVPGNASAVMLNVTAANPTGLGFITVYPCGIDRPLASNLNFTTANIANAVLAKIGAGGKVCVYTETTTHIVADVTGYVAPNTTTNTTTTTSKPSTSSTTTTSTAPPKPTCPSPKPTIPVVECDALVALFDSTGGAKWINRNKWKSANDPCSWYGVECNDNNTHVTGIVLPRNKVSGKLPSEIGALTKVTTLDFADNFVTSLPSEIGELTDLGWLNLTANSLSGLPSKFGKLTNLTHLFLDRNVLTALPDTVGNLTKLQALNLDGNRLRSVPDTIGNLANLKALYLARNQLIAIPPEIGKLTTLTDLDLYENRLTRLPTEIRKLTNLTYLNLYANRLSAIPSGIGKLTKLNDLRLSANRIQGDVTAALEPLRKEGKITYVWLWGNGCLKTTSKELSAWLTAKDENWNAAC